MDAARSRWLVGVSMAGTVAALVVALLAGSPTHADTRSAAARATSAPHRFVSPLVAAGTEVPALRTARSRTYRRLDGSYRAVVSAAPVNYRDTGGAWRPVDTRLVSDGSGGLATRAAATRTVLPATADEPAKVTSGARWMSFELRDGEDVTPKVSGSEATYVEALENVDATYVAQATGVKETLTLTDAGAPSAYRFALKTSPGLAPSLRADGAVVLRDQDEKVRFWIPAPTVKAADEKAASTRHVAYRLEDQGRTLAVVVDPRWLAGAAFPVEVDPTVYAGDWTSCTLAGGTLASTSGCNGTTLQIGHDTDRSYRAALRFDIAGLGIPPIASVISSELAMTLSSQTTTDAVTQVDVAALGKPLAPGATWQSHDGTNAWTLAGGDALAEPPGNPGVMYQDYIPGWVTFDISAIAERWIRDPADNDGLLLRAHDEGADNVLAFGGQTSTDGGPVLVVNYRLSPGLRADQTYTRVDIDDHNSIAVNASSGNIAVSGKDIHLPGADGMDLDVTRVFNGQALGDHNGAFGSAWTENINGAAFIGTRTWYDDARVIYADGGSIYRFDRDYPHDTADTLAYISPPGIDAELTVDTDTGESTLTDAGGRVWTYAASVDGSRFTLKRIEDGDGDHIDLEPASGDPYTLASITDTNNDTLTFTHGTDGELTQITDADNNQWTYTVDTTDGKDLLTQVEAPDDDTTTYQYSDDPYNVVDRLDKITDADGHDVDLAYGPDGDGTQITKITRHIDSNAAHNRVWQFDYTPDPSDGHACDATVGSETVVGRTVRTDPDNNSATYCYNKRGEVIQTWGQVPAVLSDPVISGTANDGEELTASTGTWSGTSPITYTYQWLHCNVWGNDCEPIEDETDPEYVIDSAYVLGRIGVEVTATNALGHQTARSALTSQVAPVAPSLAGSMTIDGRTRVGETLSLNVGDWSGTGPIDYARQWQRCDSAGANCADITGATNNQYTLTAQDLDKRLRVVAGVSNAYFYVGSFTSQVSGIVAGPAGTVAIDMTPVAQPLDPTDEEHIELTAAIINKIAPYHSSDAPCNAVCEAGAAEIQALAASLPPEDNVFGPLGENPELNRLLPSSDTVRRIVQGAGDAVILAGLVPVAVPASVAIPVVATIGLVYVVAVYTDVMGGPRFIDVEAITPVSETPMCGIYPNTSGPCPIIGAKAVRVSEGTEISANGSEMPYDGYMYKYKVSEGLGYLNALATCPNYLGLPQTAPSDFGGRVAEGTTTLCTDLVNSAPNEIAVAPAGLYPPSTDWYRDPTTPPVGPDDVQTQDDPNWPGPGSFGSTKDKVADAVLTNEELEAMLAYLHDPRCHPNPTLDTVTIPTIENNETGQHYADCLKTLGLNPSVRAKPIPDADTTKAPGAALSSNPGPNTELEPGEPVTVIVNPSTTQGGGGSGDASTLRDIEAGLIAHNPELVSSVPNFETETVPVVALECAKRVELAEEAAERDNVDSTVDIDDCGDAQHRGLPMYVSGSTTPQATQNDINGLKANPFWVVLHRRFVPDPKSSKPQAWKFTKKERNWYKNQPGCANKVGFAFPTCDEFPYFATLQGQFGLLKTKTPHVETVEAPQNLLQGSLLSKFYLGGGNGNTGYNWHGCNVTGQPRTQVTVTADRFLALPTKRLPTIGICNTTP
jgi:hypothetical protein